MHGRPAYESTPDRAVLYARDPDGNEFEIMWMVPRDQWGEFERRGIVAPLDLERESARFSRTRGD